jgi:HEPN domain-containing protein
VFEKKHYAYCLFFCHLAVEKELKRLYLLHKKEVPPFIHNFVRIVEEADLALGESLLQDLRELTT